MPLPAELIYGALLQLSQDTHEDNQALLTSGLVSKVFLAASRDIFFGTRTIIIGAERNDIHKRSTRFITFFQLLDNPLASFVYPLRLDIDLYDEEARRIFLDAMTRIRPTISSLRLIQDYSSRETPGVRLHTIRILGPLISPHIQNLTIGPPLVAEFLLWLEIASEFQRLEEIKFLFIGDCELEGRDAITSRAPPTLRTLNLTNLGQPSWIPLVEWASRRSVALSKLVVYPNPIDDHTEATLLTALHHSVCSKVVHIHFPTTRTLGVDISHLKSLRMLELDISIPQSHPDYRKSESSYEALLTLSSLSKQQGRKLSLTLKLRVNGTFYPTLDLDDILVDLASSLAVPMTFDFCYIPGGPPSALEHIARWLPRLEKLTDIVVSQEEGEVSWVMTKARTDV